MSEKSSTFAPMDKDMQLRLARARIAQLLAEKREALELAGGFDKESLERQLRAEYETQIEQQKAYYTSLIDGMRRDFEKHLEEIRKAHKVELDDLRKTLTDMMNQQKENFERIIQTLKEQGKENVRMVLESKNDSEEATRRENAMLKTQLAKAFAEIEDYKKLARHNQGKRFKRSSEKKKLLNNRATVSREEEKENYPDTDGPKEGGNDTPDGNNKAESSKKGSYRVKDKPDGRKDRTDYQKNKPYTDNPIYHRLSEYFTLPLGGKFVMRNGCVDSWWYRVIKRIPEHYEEHFYEVAQYSLPGEGRFLTMSNDRVVKGCPFDNDMISYILSEHFCYNCTFQKIVEKLKSVGLNLNPQTLGDQIHKVIGFFRKEMSGAWENAMQETHNWNVDETSVLVGIEEDGKRKYKKKYIWGIKAKVAKLAWFIYEYGSRGLKAIKEFMSKFIGFFTSDGYVVYKALDDDIKNPGHHRSACLVHIRRGFVDAIDENRQVCSWFIDLIGRMFAWEYEYKKEGLSADEIRRRRLKDLQPLMSMMEKKLEQYAKSGYRRLGKLTTKALIYMKNEWSAMKSVLLDGNVELSNNIAEQMMRHVKLVLKNSLNIGSEESAKDYAFMYSMIESCSMNKVNTQEYIKHLLDVLPDKSVDRGTILPCFWLK